MALLCGYPYPPLSVDQVGKFFAPVGDIWGEKVRSILYGANATSGLRNHTYVTGKDLLIPPPLPSCPTMGVHTPSQTVRTARSSFCLWVLAA